ncbi:MAG: queuosine precursor transporter [Pseudomonadota bacterium]
MDRTHIPGILAMALIVLASNILVQFLFGNWLTWGAFTYPLAFLVTDLMNRLYGPKAARQVVVVGFIVGIFCSLVGTQILRSDFLALFGVISDEAYPLVTFRVALGSGLAFLTAQLIDVQIFDRLRDGRWWRAPLWSTLIGSTVDTAIFFTIAFSAVLNGLEPENIPGWAQDGVPLLGMGPEVALWVSLAVADWGVKLTLALIALVPFRLIVRRRAEARELA